MPWYLAWALPFAIAVGNRTWIAFTALAFLSYLLYVDRGEATWWLWLEYVALFTLAAFEHLHRRRYATRPRPSSPGCATYRKSRVRACL